MAFIRDIVLALDPLMIRLQPGIMFENAQSTIKLHLFFHSCFLLFYFAPFKSLSSLCLGCVVILLVDVWTRTRKPVSFNSSSNLSISSTSSNSINSDESNKNERKPELYGSFSQLLSASHSSINYRKTNLDEQEVCQLSYKLYRFIVQCDGMVEHWRRLKLNNPKIFLLYTNTVILSLLWILTHFTDLFFLHTILTVLLLLPKMSEMKLNKETRDNVLKFFERLDDGMNFRQNFKEIPNEYQVTFESDDDFVDEPDGTTNDNSEVNESLKNVYCENEQDENILREEKRTTDSYFEELKEMMEEDMNRNKAEVVVDFCTKYGLSEDIFISYIEKLLDENKKECISGNKDECGGGDKEECGTGDKGESLEKFLIYLFTYNIFLQMKFSSDLSLTETSPPDNYLKNFILNQFLKTCVNEKRISKSFSFHNIRSSSINFQPEIPFNYRASTTFLVDGIDKPNEKFLKFTSFFFEDDDEGPITDAKGLRRKIYFERLMSRKRRIYSDTSYASSSNE
ncbi:hypothetical protein SNEBB_003437 [Seison nebaliae]|nr:hypothetical protein SNEBB_003437 [Seison nebaliae]